MGVQTMQMGQKAAAQNISKDHCNRSSMAREMGGPRAAGQGEVGVGTTRSSAFRMAAGARDSLKSVERKLQEFEENMFSEEEEAQANALHRKFDLAMGAAVVINIFWIAFEMDFGPEDGTKLADRMPWFIVQSIFLSVFILEIAVRMCWEGRRWPFQFWNWFDTVVVVCSVADVWVLSLLEDEATSLKALSILRLARLIRLVRMVKLVRTLHSLYVMVMAFLHALRSMCFLGGIMFFGMLIFSIIATVIIGRNDAFKDVQIYDDTAVDRFGHVYASMYSLFELMTLEGWQLVARPLVEKQPAIFIFIGTFIMIFTYGLLNMVVATVVEKTIQQTNEMKAFDDKQMMKSLKMELLLIQKHMMEADDDRSGSLTREEFRNALETDDEYGEKSKLRTCLNNLNVPDYDAMELFEVLDHDGDMQLTVEELIDGIGKLQSGRPSVYDALDTLASVKRQKVMVEKLQEQFSSMDNRQRKMEECIQRQDEMMKEMLMRVRYSLKSPPVAVARNGRVATAYAERKPVSPVSPVVQFRPSAEEAHFITDKPSLVDISLADTGNLGEDSAFKIIQGDRGTHSLTQSDATPPPDASVDIPHAISETGVTAERSEPYSLMSDSNDDSAKLLDSSHGA